MKKWFFVCCVAVSLFVVSCGNQETSYDESIEIESPVASESLQEISEESSKEQSANVENEPDERVLQVKNPSWEYYVKEDIESYSSSTVHLELMKEEANNITDVESWVQEHDVSIPQIPYGDEKYFYEYVRDSYPLIKLLIRDAASGETLFTVDFTDFSIPDECNEEYADFVNEGIRYAKIQDQVLYVATGHNTYTEWAPHNGYITAVDLESGEVLWKTEPQICNSDNFEIIGDSIVCGYGFTSENDYLYVLNKADGKWIERIPVASAVDYIVRKENTLYVRTYNTDYEFSVWNSDGTDEVEN
ncbi:MAG: PQQ-binding-like beta-propeller repeat protein [Lachnospiraceae bacterium]|nr:PQQ-binding-like beta-propeller repeat protein [Lachnospiraceae bacterium]